MLFKFPFIFGLQSRDHFQGIFSLIAVPFIQICHFLWNGRIYKGFSRSDVLEWMEKQLLKIFHDNEWPLNCRSKILGNIMKQIFFWLSCEIYSCREVSLFLRESDIIKHLILKSLNYLGQFLNLRKKLVQPSCRDLHVFSVLWKKNAPKWKWQ